MLGSGDPCYIAQAQAYDAAFNTFFRRLAADGINSTNTEFIVTADEATTRPGPMSAGPSRPLRPTATAATVAGTTVSPDVACTYPAGTFGELSANITRLLATQKSDTTPFSLESDSAPQFHATGKPAPASPTVRTLERDMASLTAANP